MPREAGHIASQESFCQEREKSSETSGEISIPALRAGMLISPMTFRDWRDSR